MSRLDALGPYAAPLLAAALIGYLLGALPFGYLVARANGVNIFEHGSRSTGATNVRRVVGKGAGNTVFVLDVAKGAVAAGWLRLWFYGPGHLGEVLGVVGLVAAMLGHSFSCFTRFRGGKGVATSAGAFLVLMPPVTVVAAVVWTLTFFTSGYVSLASILAALSLPVGALVFGDQLFIILVALAVAIFVVVRHRTNILRLCNGTENKAKGKGGGYL